MQTDTMARSEEHFAITFDGQAVEGGRMSVQQLAPSLVALSQAVQTAQRVLEPAANTPSLDIHAVREGSFAVDLIVAEGNLIQDAIAALNTKEAAAGAALGGLAGLVSAFWGAVKLVQHLTRRIVGRTDLENGEVRIEFDDGQTLTIPQESLLLGGNRQFREAIREVVEPLESEGVDSIALESEGRESIQVEPDDLPAFDLPAAEEEELLDSTTESVLQPVTVAFSEGNKWRVTDGESTFYATILDDKFVDRIQAGESFAKGDIIRAKVRTQQFRDNEGNLRTERTILEVTDHIRAEPDVPLPFERGGDDQP